VSLRFQNSTLSRSFATGSATVCWRWFGGNIKKKEVPVLLAVAVVAPDDPILG
jgi:hypothetical protein